MNRLEEAKEEYKDDPEALKNCLYIEERIENGVLFDFEGQNCDDCQGWDGISRRCECGNNRVCWIYDNNCWYGETY